jgi:hypothetical protein
VADVILPGEPRSSGSSRCASPKPCTSDSRIALTRAQNSPRGLFDQNEQSPTLPLGSEFGACRNAKTVTNQVSVKFDWRPQVYCFVTSKSVVLFCSLSIKAGFGGLTIGRDRHLEDADHLAVTLISFLQHVLALIFTDTLVMLGSPFIGAPVPFHPRACAGRRVSVRHPASLPQRTTTRTRRRFSDW